MKLPPPILPAPRQRQFHELQYRGPATRIYIFVNDFLKSHPNLAHGRRSNNAEPAFTDAEVLTIGLMQSSLGVATLRKTYDMIAAILLPANEDDRTAALALAWPGGHRVGRQWLQRR